MAARSIHPPAKRSGLEPDRNLVKNSRIAKPTKAVDIARVKASASVTQVRPVHCPGWSLVVAEQGVCPRPLSNPAVGGPD